MARALTWPRTRGELLERYLRPHRARGVAIFILVLAETVMWAGTPVIAARFIDLAGDSATATATLVVLAIGYIGAGFVTQGISVLAGRLVVDVAQRTTNELRVDLTNHVLRMNEELFARHDPGDLLERVDGDTTTLEKFLSTFVFDVVATTLLAVVIVVVSLLTDLWLGSVLLVAAAISVVAAVGAQRRAAPSLRAERVARAELSGFAQDRLAAREDIRASAAENHTLDELRRPLESLQRSTARAGVGLRLSASALDLGVALAMAAVLATGAVLLEGDVIRLSAVFLVYQYTTLLALALFRLSMRMTDMAAASGSVERILALFSRPSIGSGAHRQLPGGALSVRFDSVSVQYPGSRPALTVIDVSIPAASSLGVIGETGSGKSTLLKLLWRGVDATGGMVTLGGAPLPELDAEALQARIGVISQNAHVFPASVRDNVTMFDDSVRDDTVRDALATVGLQPWLASLGDDLDSVVNEAGATVSTGQAYLIATARILVHRPDLLLMDEATAHFDPATERAVHRVLADLMVGRTTILVSHNGLMLDSVAQVLVLDAGVAAWCGPREALPAPLVRRLLKANQT